MKHSVYFPDNGFYEKVEKKAREMGVSVSPYIRIALLEKWRREEQEKKRRGE